MELRQLKSFIKTAETLNFSEAARQLSISQSTLSQQIKALEEELGTTLFVRDTHSVMLSESGEALLPLARQTINDAESCYTQIKDLKALVSGRLDIGITYTFEPLIADTVKEFMDRYPGIKLNILVRTKNELIKMLKKREVDFALAFKPEIHDENIESIPLFEDGIMAIVHKEHPVAGMGSISLNEVLRYRMVMPSRKMMARHQLERFIESVYNDKNLALEIDSITSVLDMVECREMVSILTNLSILGRDKLTAVPIDMKDNRLTCGIYMLKNTIHKKSAGLFISMLSESAAVRKLSGLYL